MAGMTCCFMPCIFCFPCVTFFSVNVSPIRVRHLSLLFGHPCSFHKLCCSRKVCSSHSQSCIVICIVNLDRNWNTGPGAAANRLSSRLHCSRHSRKSVIKIFWLCIIRLRWEVSRKTLWYSSRVPRWPYVIHSLR